jgi:murein DD-endopeptidase MepM/ murein hydrolase activator NlpD
VKKRGAPNVFGPRLTSRSFFWQRGLIGKGGKAEMPLGGLGMAPEPGKKLSLLERIWAWLHRTFPERQIYIRSDGRVQFFTFGPSLQATLAGLVLIFLGWVAFATVNVVFKDRIIAAKDNRFQQMQSAYENRLADLQISYDELNGALVGAEDKFKATADALSAKQNAITGFLNRKNRLENAITAHNAGDTGAVTMAGAQQMVPARDSGIASDSVGFSGAPPDMDENADSNLVVMPDPPPAQPRVQKSSRASMLDLKGMWKGLSKLASVLMERRPPSLGQIRTAYAEHPMLKSLDSQTKRLAALSGTEAQLMADTQGALDSDVGLLRAAVKRTGINPDQFLRKVRAVEGVGGPDVPLDNVHVQGAADRNFDNAYLKAGAVLAELTTLSSEMGHIPLAVPVTGVQFERSSGFGARIDPFTGRYAFHPGVDFAGPWGAPVASTAPGTVVFAGNRGGYGNMVEIDHGFGIHTRYGHLSRITVGVGSKVSKGSMVGKMGSTGRSTGPHVHYEVWYDNVVRNPNNFIEAGRHVL